jgi:hypothetical protein
MSPAVDWIGPLRSSVYLGTVLPSRSFEAEITRRQPRTLLVSHSFLALYMGLDLGQSADYTALAIVQDLKEVNEKGELIRSLHLRYLERYPLRTPYNGDRRWLGRPNVRPPPLFYIHRPPAPRGGCHRRGQGRHRPPQEQETALQERHYHGRGQSHLRRRRRLAGAQEGPGSGPRGAVPRHHPRRRRFSTRWIVFDTVILAVLRPSVHRTRVAY